MRQVFRTIRKSAAFLCAAPLIVMLMASGARAVTLAKRAVKVTGGRRPEPLAMLAAALAEEGRHEEAVRAAERALALAQVSSAPLAVDLETRLALHRKGLPIRAGSDR